VIKKREKKIFTIREARDILFPRSRRSKPKQKDRL